MTAAGLLLGSCAGLLAARRLCATDTRKRAGEGGPEAAQASWEREGSLSGLAYGALSRRSCRTRLRRGAALALIVC